ncbi:MAG: 2,3,4,5-tetrahydropyridine-2,6-dicarboxylate N-succinyltransferase, partial [Corynebacterium sp.]|nr:2,3,4,5-tetrahydropyridine-2,6-dicarboxylate N-succinyltransferase [Corynebacterium sp.]
MTSASARGLATITHDGTVLDVWFPAVYTDKTVETTETKRLEEVPQQFSAL